MKEEEDARVRMKRTTKVSDDPQQRKLANVRGTIVHLRANLDQTVRTAGSHRRRMVWRTRNHTMDSAVDDRPNGFRVPQTRFACAMIISGRGCGQLHLQSQAITMARFVTGHFHDCDVSRRDRYIDYLVHSKPRKETKSTGTQSVHSTFKP